MALISLSDSWVSPAMRALIWPTLRCPSTNAGNRISAMIVSCQLSSSIATNAAITVTVLPITLETVFESTLATPPTSFCRRDWITPVFVRVKKPSSIDCRCEKSLTLRSPMTWLPTLAVNLVCTIPSTWLTTNTSSMASTSHSSTGMFGVPAAGNSPSSKTRCVIRGGRMPRAADTSTRATMTPSCSR